jgi:hypothetical protein
MIRYLLCLVFLVFNQVSAQVTLSGKAVDATTKAPLFGANIYINNSTIGTETDSLGMFKLTVPNSGKVELIISHVIYQKQWMVISTENVGELLIEMLPQQNVLQEVVIKLKKKNKLKAKSWTELFAANLIGSYKDISIQCKLVNPDVLYFDYDEDTKKLKVFAQGPIMIENGALGYMIRMDLDEFTYDFTNDVIAYKYSVFFEDFVAPQKQMERFAEKRETLFAGSTMHFMRSLHSKTTAAEGFTIHKYTPKPNKERERVNAIIQQKKAELYALDVNPGDDISRFFLSRDTVRYYHSVIEQPKTLSYDTIKVSPDALVKTSKDLLAVNFHTRDTLMVTYTGLKQSKTKVSGFSSTAFDSKIAKGKKSVKEAAISVIHNSYLYFFNKEGINILPNGYYPDMGIFIYGDMGERRLAGLLPFDYNPNVAL